MKIIKPVEFGDSFFCYKCFHAISILGCLDARGSLQVSILVVLDQLEIHILTTTATRRCGLIYI